MKITSFLMFAEPEKLQYPYVASIESLASFSDTIIINFASSHDPAYRLFEKESYDKILELKRKYLGRVNIEIMLNETWPNMYKLKYEDFRLNIQNYLDMCKEGWLLKCDGDNVFQDCSRSKMRDFLSKSHDKHHLLSFPRINVINKDKFCLNYSHQDVYMHKINKPITDIYAINIDLLKSSLINYEITKDPKHWCKVVFDQDVDHCFVTDKDLMSINYDATFFTKTRLVDFWKKTHQAYEDAMNRRDHTINMSDEEIIKEYANYRRKKSVGVINVEHPTHVATKINSLTEEHWGYNNFGNKI